ncbi:MAG: ECF-type sigma factor, partial [Acidobacteriota bacterium]|nr:ECF-type sigma factor [Acidobacteriota bacterium]
MAPQNGVQRRDRKHFISLASEMMRRVLVDQACAHLREKRGGGSANLSLSEAGDLDNGRDIQVLDLYFAMGRLAEID